MINMIKMILIFNTVMLSGLVNKMSINCYNIHGLRIYLKEMVV